MTQPLVARRPISRENVRLERRVFVAQTAAQFLASKFGAQQAHDARNAVEFAMELADALEQAHTAPWPETIDALIDQLERPR